MLPRCVVELQTPARLRDIYVLWPHMGRGDVKLGSHKNTAESGKCSMACDCNHIWTRFASKESALWAQEKQTITVPLMCKNKDLLFKEHTTVSTTSWCFWQESQKEQIGSAKLHSALTVWLHCCGGYDRCWNSTSNLNKMHQAQSWGSTFPPLKMICSLWGVRM